MADTINDRGVFMPGSSSSINNLRVCADNTRHVLSLNGVDQYLRLAKPVVGVGQGTIKIVCKLRDVGSNFYLFDNSENANRFYCYIEQATGVVRKPGGIAAKVNGVSAAVVTYGELIEIELSGDFTGLTIGQLFIRFDEVEAAQPQVFSISYEDEAQSFAYDFTVAQNYFLPVGADLGRTHTSKLSTINIPTNYASEVIPESEPVEVGKVYYFKLKLVSGPSGGAARLRSVQGSSGDYVWVGGTLEGVSVCEGTAITLQASVAGDYVFETIEVREIPNALILQSPSANSADDFEPMVQRPDGHWVGTENLISNGKFSNGFTDWQQTGDAWAVSDGVATSDGSQTGSDYMYQQHVHAVDEHITLGITASILGGDAAISFTNGGSLVPLVEGKNNIDGQLLTNPSVYVWCDSDYIGTVDNIYAHHLVKLSDYLQKQFIIAQIKSKVAAYQAKNKTRNITTSDGIDDRIADLDITLSGDFDIYGWFYVNEMPAVNKALLGGDGGAAPSPDAFTLYVNNFGKVSTQYPKAAASHYNSCDFQVGSVCFYHLNRDGDILTLKCNDDVTQHTISDLQSIRVTQLSAWSAGLQFDGANLGCVIIDHENPLPAGQGGQSGFWPLDDPKGAVAANKLGLDKKGNVVVKDGAGLGGHGTWHGLPADFSSTAEYIRNADGAYVSDTETLDLSAELQRQWDLAIVETSVGKLLKKAEKSMVLAEFDGVDDGAEFTPCILNGDFKVQIPYALATGAAGDLALLADTTDADWFRVDATNESLDTKVSSVFSHIDGLVVTDTNLGVATFERVGDKLLISKSPTLLATYDCSQDPVTLTALGKRGGAFPNYFDGYLGYTSIKDYADPKNSRFYVHNPDGYLEDKLHSDGSMNGTYSGMPVDFSNIKAFKKSGDDWISVDQLTTIKGA